MTVTELTGNSARLTKQLQKQQHENISSEVDDRLKARSYKKSRRKTSTKCGCKWAVHFTKPPPGEKNPIIRVTSLMLDHTNGCVPSPSTFHKHERRLGRVYSKSLLMQGKQKPHILFLMSSILLIGCFRIYHLGLDYYNSGALYHMYRHLLHKHTIINDCDHLSIANAQGHIFCFFFGWEATSPICNALFLCYTMLMSLPFPAITNFILRVKYYKDTMEEIPLTESSVTNEVFLSVLVVIFLIFFVLV